MLSTQPNAPLTVSQLNRQVKQLLETQYPAIPVQGEISTLSKPASGHIYFTLKDAQAQIRCAMFKGQLVKNRYIPKQGDEVLVYGRVSLYEGRGDYQLIASTMQPVGEGALQAAFFKLKERLSAEGLFDEAHKKPLPKNVQTVGVVTSSTGAAFHDILTVLERRYPAIRVILYPSQVQGNEATATIVQAIETANRRKEVDVLIVGRGGGSLEDLWSFNTEPVAKAIYHSELPVISAVGHEVDISIADFVADVRAATPSQAAEMISPDQYELMQRVDQKEQRLVSAIGRILKMQSSSLLNLSRRLRSPAATVADWQRKLTQLNGRLNRAILRPLSQSHERIGNLSHRLHRVSPSVKIKQDRSNLEAVEKRLVSSGSSLLDPRKSALRELIAKLNVLSPLSTLERGYSITRDENMAVIQDSSTVKAGDIIESLLKDGSIRSQVLETQQKNNEPSQKEPEK